MKYLLLLLTLLPNVCYGRVYRQYVTHYNPCPPGIICRIQTKEIWQASCVAISHYDGYTWFLTAGHCWSNSEGDNKPQVKVNGHFYDIVKVTEYQNPQLRDSCLLTRTRDKIIIPGELFTLSSEPPKVGQQLKWQGYPRSKPVVMHTVVDRLEGPYAIVTRGSPPQVGASGGALSDNNGTLFGVTHSKQGQLGRYFPIYVVKKLLKRDHPLLLPADPIVRPAPEPVPVPEPVPEPKPPALPPVTEYPVIKPPVKAPDPPLITIPKPVPVPVPTPTPTPVTVPTPTPPVESKPTILDKVIYHTTNLPWGDMAGLALLIAGGSVGGVGGSIAAYKGVKTGARILKGLVGGTGGAPTSAFPLVQQVEATLPLPRKLDEARQLLQLVNAEGRNTVHDGLFGLLADAELEKLVEAGDPTAIKLRSEIHKRLNEIAPLSTDPLRS